MKKSLDSKKLLKTESVSGDYLSVLNTIEETQKWEKVREWIEDNSHPFFKQLREEQPILVTKECTLLALYDDVIEALNQPTIFTVALYKPKMGDFLMTEDDTPMHNHDREVMMSLLKREDLPKIREYVRKKSEEVLDEAQGSIDLVKSFTRKIPVSMVQDIFGLDGISQTKLLNWSFLNQFDAFNNQHFQNFENREKIEPARKKSNVSLLLYALMMFVRKYFYILIGKPKDDTVTRLLKEHSPFKKGFNVIRQAINTAGLLIGTVETTSEAVSNALYQLNSHPDHLKLAIELAQGESKEEIESFDKIVWEALRSQPIAPYLMRQPSKDYVIAKGTNRETLIPKGTTVLCLITSAMFDPSAFKNPDKFDPTRSYGKSFQFGYGHHECIGKMIGMVMIPEMVRQVLLRQEIKQVSEPDYEGGPFSESHHFAWKD